MDMGFWSFSDDDVLGQQADSEGYSMARNFEKASMTVYPNRFISADTAKQLIEGTEGQDVDAGRLWYSVIYSMMNGYGRLMR